MEDYLKDSPSEYSNVAAETDTPNYKYNLPMSFNFDTLPSQSDMTSSRQQPQQQQQSQQQQQQSNPSNNNEFSLNLNIAGFTNDNNQGTNSNTNTNSAFNSNTQLASNEYLSPTGFNYNATTGSESNTYPGSPGSFTNEPFLDDIDNVAFSQAVLAPQLNTQSQLQQQQPQQQQRQQSLSPNPPLSPHQQFLNVNNSANLDELISPPNTSGGGFDVTSPFLNPQYFSPPTRGQSSYNPLNAIAENPLASPYSDDVFSPDLSRNGSISGPPGGGFNNGSNQLDITATGQYLSPQFNPGYASPPIYEPYLQSPPPSNSQYPNRSGTNSVANMSTSIPARSEWHHNALSPPPQTTILSTSVPSSGNSGNRVPISKEGIPTKQLSKEEKAKRRREFHNAVERRRRDLIKERIKELGVIVPPSLLNPQLSAVQALQRKSSIDSNNLNDLISSIKVKETKPNKSTILNKSVDYINHLNYVLRQQEFVREQLVSQIEALEKTLGETEFGSGSGYTDTNNPNQSPQAYYMESSNNGNSGNPNFLGGTDIPIYNPDEFFSDIHNNQF